MPERRDLPAVLALVDDDCYWRDLVSFTWNIKTCEGKDAIAAMLGATLAQVQPSGWRIDGESSLADGIVNAWFVFETAAARGYIQAFSAKMGKPEAGWLSFYRILLASNEFNYVE